MIQTVINPSQSLYWTTGSKEGSAQTLKQFLPHVKHAIPSSVANFGLISVETVSPQEFFSCSAHEQTTASVQRSWNRRLAKVYTKTACTLQLLNYDYNV